jgi:hypothetical protein
MEDYIERTSRPLHRGRLLGDAKEACEVEDKCFLEAPIKLRQGGLDLN